MLKTNTIFLRFGNIVAFIVTLVVNGLAGTTILNGRTTAEVSDLYSSPFTPAGYVFGIWGIIYALLTVFVIYQALPKQKNKHFQKQISVLFILSSLFNIVWLFLWQYDHIIWSVVVMFALLATLSTIYLRLGIGKSSAVRTEKLCVHLPFSVYLGWISIATIANISVALTAASWDRFGIEAATWAVIIIGVAVVLSLIMLATRRDVAFNLVVVWALLGILVNQSWKDSVVLASEVAIVIVLVAIVVTVLVSKFKR